MQRSCALFEVPGIFSCCSIIFANLHYSEDVTYLGPVTYTTLKMWHILGQSPTLLWGCVTYLGPVTYTTLRMWHILGQSPTLLWGCVTYLGPVTYTTLRMWNILGQSPALLWGCDISWASHLHISWASPLHYSEDVSHILASHLHYSWGCVTYLGSVTYTTLKMCHVIFSIGH